MEVQSQYDVIVVGGGPAGATAATLVADGGRSVLLLEREVFPRFKIGESLIPATLPTLQRLGMVDQLTGSSFPKKYSVQFYSSSGKASAPFYFSETEDESQSQTWQVLRSEFDQMMIDNAEQHGVNVQQGASVREVIFEDDRATGVRVRLDSDSTREIRSKVVVDATGQRALLGRQLQLRRTDPELKMAAAFTHFEGAERDEGIDEGATLILQTANKDSWFWYIPLPNNLASIGVVGPIDYLIRGRGKPQEVFEEELALCPGLQPRLVEARQVRDMQVLNEFSYSTSRAAGDGWVLCGDAFGFLDPMYSSGVLLALRSAEMAADNILVALEDGDLSGDRLAAFAPRMREGMTAFRRLIYAFYNKEFSFGRFLKKFPEHRVPIVRILVGDVFDHDFEPLYRDISTMVDLPLVAEIA